MGFRFRKSIRIFKGLNVNLSTRGIGLRAGIPGFNASLGPSGPALNLGIPGTGLGYRVAGGRGGGRSSYRQARSSLRAQRDAQAAAIKAQEMYEASSEHAAAEAVIAGLAGVLGGRNRQVLKFDDLLRARGAYVARPFQPAAYEANAPLLRQKVTSAFPLWPWLTMLTVGSCGGFVILDGAAEQIGGIALVCVSAGVFLRRQLANRAPYRTRLDAKMMVEHEHAEVDRERRHTATELANTEQRAAEETYRARLRASIATNDPTALADLLEAEIADEDWPVPVVAEVEFDGIADVLIEVELPELDDVPEERTSLTQRGKLSRKPMAKRDRVAIYEDLCCGIALRLAHEAFRVLATLDRVHVRGLATNIGVSGADEDFVALTFDITRAAFGTLDLERLDPSTTVAAIGKWGGNKKGELRAVG